MNIFLRISILMVICFASFQCNTMKQTKEKGQDVMAEVTFLSATGQDPINKVITSDNVLELLPDESSVKLVQNYFEDKQIAFEYYQGISATISADMTMFEELFGILLSAKDNRFEIKNQKNSLNIPLDNLPEEIKKQLSNITLPEKMEPF